MIGRLAFRSLTAHPVRSAVLAVGFGAGVAVMAILLGVAEIVLQQAQSPALVGGGDVLIRLHPDTPARLVLSGTLQADALRDRIRVAAPFHTTDLFLVRPAPAEADAPAVQGERPRGGVTAPAATVRVAARGGIPSLEHALDDPETAGLSTWRDSPADLAWTRESPERLLRHIDRFHPIPAAPRWERSWAEWLYFNGRTAHARFYLTFLVGPRNASGRRDAGVRLQLDRGRGMETFTGRAELTEDEVARAPDLTIGGSAVRLDGMIYRVSLDLRDEGGPPAEGTLTLGASAGALVPPLEITGADGWITGYVVPVLSGPLGGTLRVGGEPVSFDGGTGYHDHNWGFWEGVTWQWGQVQYEDLSFIYGRVFPPPEAADPEQMPGFLGAVGPDGPIAYATDVRITETADARGQPARIAIDAQGTALDLALQFDVDSIVVNPMQDGPLAGAPRLLQMRGRYTVGGTIGSRDVSFSAPGAAETWR